MICKDNLALKHKQLFIYPETKPNQSTEAVGKNLDWSYSRMLPTFLTKY